jgi:ribosome maturation factor RimP
MSQEEKINALISPALESAGYEIVRVQITGDKNQTLQIMAERNDEENMTVEDCAAISREISAILDVDDPISGAYALEVSSPGIDRPLVRPKDFERFAGFDARVDMNFLVEGRKKFKGKLLGIQDDKVAIRMKEETFELPFGDIRRAKLLLTQELLDAAQHN